jgi:hypothetical protein
MKILFCLLKRRNERSRCWQLRDDVCSDVGTMQCEYTGSSSKRMGELSSAFKKPKQMLPFSTV